VERGLLAMSKKSLNKAIDDLPRRIRPRDAPESTQERITLLLRHYRELPESRLSKILSKASKDDRKRRKREKEKKRRSEKARSKRSRDDSPSSPSSEEAAAPPAKAPQRQADIIPSSATIANYQKAFGLAFGSYSFAGLQSAEKLGLQQDHTMVAEGARDVIEARMGKAAQQAPPGGAQPKRGVIVRDDPKKWWTCVCGTKNYQTKHECHKCKRLRGGAWSTGY